MDSLPPTWITILPKLRLLSASSFKFDGTHFMWILMWYTIQVYWTKQLCNRGAIFPCPTWLQDWFLVRLRFIWKSLSEGTRLVSIFSFKWTNIMEVQSWQAPIHSLFLMLRISKTFWVWEKIHSGFLPPPSHMQVRWNGHCKLPIGMYLSARGRLSLYVSFAIDMQTIQLLDWSTKQGEAPAPLWPFYNPAQSPPAALLLERDTAYLHFKVVYYTLQRCEF